jgi:protein disulfide-isomerase-like protein
VQPSEEPPASNDGPVKVIVGSTFDAEVANGGKWVLLEAYAPWCGHCKKLMPVWEDLGEAFKESSGTVTIAKVDATANDLPKSLGIKGFPTLLLFKGDGTPPMDYSGERDYAALASFITKKTGAKPTAGFKPKSGSSSSSGESLDKTIIRFFASEFQVPWMSAGYKVSGLYLAAICVFLLFVAAIALVIACMSKEPAAAPAKGKKD